MLPVPIDAPLRYRRGYRDSARHVTYIAWMCRGQLIPFDHAAWRWGTTATVSSGSGRISVVAVDVCCPDPSLLVDNLERAGIGNRKSGSCRFRCMFRVADLRRSEEHTSELQSPYDLVCRLLLEK